MGDSVNRDSPDCGHASAETNQRSSTEIVEGLSGGAPDHTII
jgi:hypothetical protein